MKSSYVVLPLCACLSAPALAVEFEVSGQAEVVSGIDNNVYFTDKSSKDGGYASGRLRLRADAIFSPTLRFNSEIEVGDTIGKKWSEREGISVGYYSERHEHFNVRNAYIAWGIPSYNSQLNIGVENINLPSATFGNPILNASLGGMSYHKTFDNDDKMQIFVAQPIYSHDYIKRMYIAGMTFELKWNDFTLEPYYLYANYKYRDNAGLGFVEKLEKSYMNVLGFASTYNITKQLEFKFDALYGDQNNDTAHYYEFKGYHTAAVLDYHTDVTYGAFGWYSSGNGKKLDEHDDFGFVPMISSGGFAPTRLGFRSRDGIGRQGVLSETGAGTAGVGFHIKDVPSIDRLKHTFRVAYIIGTSSHEGNGAPVSATRPGYMQATESGYMTDQDYAVEFNIDSSYEVKRNLTVGLDLAYIKSGFKNKTYDKNPFNAQVGLKYTF